TVATPPVRAQGSLQSGPLAPQAAQTAAAVTPGRPFALTSPWNTPVDGLAADPRSARFLRLAAERRGVIALPANKGVRDVVRRVRHGLVVNVRRWSPLVVSDQMPGAVATKVFCRQAQCTPTAKQVRTLSLPRDAKPDPRYDGWMTVLDAARGTG